MANGVAKMGDSSTTCTVKIFQYENPHGNPPQSKLYIENRVHVPGSNSITKNCTEWISKGSRNITEALPRITFGDQKGSSCNSLANKYCRENATFDTDECSLSTGENDPVQFDCTSEEQTTSFGETSAVAVTLRKKTFSSATTVHSNILPDFTANSHAATTDGNLEKDRLSGEKFPIWLIIIVLAIIALLGVTTALIVMRRRKKRHRERGNYNEVEFSSKTATTTLNQDSSAQTDRESKLNPLYGSHGNSPYELAKDIPGRGHRADGSNSNSTASVAHDSKNASTSAYQMASEVKGEAGKTQGLNERVKNGSPQLSAPSYEMASDLKAGTKNGKQNHNYEVIDDNFNSSVEDLLSNTPSNRPSDGRNVYHMIGAAGSHVTTDENHVTVNTTAQGRDDTESAKISVDNVLYNL